MRALLFGCGMLVGLTTLTVAMGSVPQRGRITDDTAIYQNLSEIKVAKQAMIDFDSDISRLSRSEDRYHERLPRLRGRVRSPMKRISAQKYRFSGKRTNVASE